MFFKIAKLFIPNVASDAMQKMGSNNRSQLYRPKGSQWSLKETLGWQNEFYKEIQDSIRAVVRKHLNKKTLYNQQVQASIAMFHQEVQSIHPVLTEYPSSWPIDAFAEMYLKNTSAEHRKYLKARNLR
ncbi:hypothetical protein BDQ17DRAFT_1434610 [Cyathus striatus]|nr:hypothetical protein BDQ17DRAFT_1434610 [Cyathus striatus]